MLFSTDEQEFQNELQAILPFASSFEFEGFRNLLFDTEQKFMLPLLGESLYKRLSDTSMETERTMCQKAIVNITVYENFTLLNTKIVPGGFVRITSENTGTLYKYQETELKNRFRRNGYDNLDQIVDYFLKNIERFPEFKSSNYYTQGRGELVPNRLVFSEYYKPIGNIVFRYLKSFIRRAETLDLSAIADIDGLKKGILEDLLTDKDKRTINLIRPVIVNLAVAYAIEDRGINITDTGVWIERRIAGDGTSEFDPTGDQATIAAQNHRKIASRYLEELQKHLSECECINPYIRNNNEKKTVWL